MLRKINLFKVNNINFASLFIDEYIVVNFNIVERIENKSTKICFTKYLHIVDELKTNIFINNNILKSKKMMSNINKNIININNYNNLIVLLIVTFQKKTN